ncbi:hypothetical protein BV378_21700 [Nostoc sp. RF31YmG]|nr:hypothetical protein BV378_21700 [Nostoc sp. RF31YmG]
MSIKKIIVTLLGAGSSVFLASSDAQALTLSFSGNGNSGFGGVLGTGSLQISDNGATIQATFNKGTGGFNDAVVIYIDSVAGGFANTSGFNDQNDGLRQAISGASSSVRSTVFFPSGFNADFAVALGVNPNFNFGGLWQLANGGNNSLIYIDSVNLAPLGNTTSTNYTFDFDVSQIGLTSNSGASFKFVATYLNPLNSFRSDEAIGNGIGPGNPGQNPVTFTSFETYTTAVPVPFEFSSTPGLLTLAAIWWGRNYLKRIKRLFLSRM